MHELFVAYFSKYPHKQWFYINNIVIDLSLPQSFVSKELEKISRDYPQIGYYNRDTGWFKRKSGFKRKRARSWTYWIYLIVSIISILLFPYYYTPNIYANPLFMLIAFFLIMIVLMFLFHEAFDKRAYLKDYKL